MQIIRNDVRFDPIEEADKFESKKCHLISIWAYVYAAYRENNAVKPERVMDEFEVENKKKKARNDFQHQCINTICVRRCPQTERHGKKPFWIAKKACSNMTLLPKLCVFQSFILFGHSLFGFFSRSFRPFISIGSTAAGIVWCFLLVLWFHVVSIRRSRIVCDLLLVCCWLFRLNRYLLRSLFLAYFRCYSISNVSAAI